MTDQVNVMVRKGRRTGTIPGRRVGVGVSRLLAFDDGDGDRRILEALGKHLLGIPGLALYGGDALLDALLTAVPELADHAETIITDEAQAGTVAPRNLPATVKAVFLARLKAAERAIQHSRLPRGMAVVEPSVIGEIAPDLVPPAAWIALARNIYPFQLPELRFESGLDLVLLDCPARNLALLPNGLAYVHNALGQTDIRFQTFDLDILSYHRFHIRRLFDEGGAVVLASGREMPTDPWQAEHYDLWSADDVIAWFDPLIDEAVEALAAAAPKVLGLSVHACNDAFSRRLVERLRPRLPELVVLVGGFSCYNPEIGLQAFPQADYMCIGEADLTIGPLAEALARGERPRDLPGVLGRFDTPGRRFTQAPMAHNLDQLDFPRYQWFGIDIYRNWNGYQLVPIIASRGCRWSRCTFCAERFFWRIRAPKPFVDELEWLVEQGCTLFMFNESDLNGMPERVLEICDEIIARGLKVKLTGQLRIHKKCDRAFFDKLRQAGFVALRFGVDAFARNTMKLQRKGYTPETVSQNLKDCWEAGIYTEVNWVIGVPGETDADVEEGIQLILANRAYIGRLANINPLILVNGSVYWLDPESHGIRFHRPKEELLAENMRYMPADAWHSEDPFIDAAVRKTRFEHIVRNLHAAGFPVGAWALRVIDDVHTARDRARAGSAEPEIVAEAEAETGLWPEAVDETSEWADSRGNYDPRHQQRKAGAYMKADAGMGEAADPGPAARLDAPVVVPFAGDLVAIEAADLDQAFQTDRRSQSVTAAGDGNRPHSRLGRLAYAVLPLKLREEARRIYRQQLVGSAAGHRGPEMHHAIAVAKGLIKARVLRWTHRSAAGVPMVSLPGRNIQVVGVAGVGALPDLVCSVNRYNVVQFECRYFGVPHGVAADWESGAIDSQPGIVTAATVRDLVAILRRMQGIVSPPKPRIAVKTSVAAISDDVEPRQVAELRDYRIISYEGWYYGIPAALGEIDLIEEDVMAMPGIIRDVSLDAVETEIHAQARA